MAVFKRVRDGQLFSPGTTVTIGRASTCALRLDASFVSGNHASLRWTARGWSIRDLNSRNGTSVDGARLKPGDSTLLTPGARVVFGAAGETWLVQSVDAPTVRATSVDGRVVEAEQGLLLLPDEDEPEAQIYEGANGAWHADLGDQMLSLKDGASLVVGGKQWVVSLPEVLPGTIEPVDRPIAPGEVAMRFRVSADEEHVEIELIGPDGTVTALAHRAHSYLLLTLARARLDAADLGPSEQGWVYQDELADMLRLDSNRLYVQIFRARQQFAKAGVSNAADLIERRRGSGQVRLGLSRVVVESF